MLFGKRPTYTHLLVGLGNPGTKYMKTRHNVGYMTVDLIMASCGAQYKRAKFHSLTGEILLDGKRVFVMKPETFMNESGQAVGEAASYYKISPENIIVVSDDVSLPVGRMRIRRSGSAGGHNGLKSIIAHLGSDAFPRIRIGIGSTENGGDLADYVLDDIPKREADLIKTCAESCVDAVKLITDGKIDEAMNQYNQSKGNTK